MAETARQASTALRKKAEPAKQVRRKVQAAEAPDRTALAKRFGAGGNLSTGLDQYGRYVLQQIDAETGKTSVVYLFVEPNGKDWKVFNGTDIIKEVKSVYKNQDTLRNELYKKGFLSKTEFETKSTSALNGAILQAATEFSTDVADAYTTEGKIKFPTFSTWITNRGSVGGEKAQGPFRDINLEDRDVIEAIVKDVYSKTTDMSPEEQNDFIQKETDRYMNQIKEGTLTTTKKVGGTDVRTQTKQFSRAQVEAELPKKIEQELPGVTGYKKSFDFLAFLDGLGAKTV